MRNLKRALSLLLSSTMVLGMVVMGSSAAGYQDVDDTYHKEAIEVLQAAGIMTGVDSAGNFNPEGTVTRNEMAVIMSNLMAYNVATYSGTSPFTDVPSWAEPYVAACWTNGITAGTSETTYGGDQTVTTAQAALMIMKALGYFQYQSDFGSDWQLSTVTQGNKIDLFNDVNSGVKEAMTRNDVAQLVLNGLESGTVEAETNGSITVGDVTIVNSVKYNYITSGQKYAYSINEALDTNNDATTSSGSIVELGEKLYQGDLTKKGSQDNFGRPAATWSYKNTEVGTYANEADYTYTNKVTNKDLYNTLGSLIVDDTKNVEFKVYYNGQSLNDVRPVKNDTSAYSHTATGTLTQVYIVNDPQTNTKDVYIVMTDTFLAEVVRANKGTDSTTLTLNYLDGLQNKSNAVAGRQSSIELASTDLVDGDRVLVTLYEDGANKFSIDTIEKAKTVTGVVTAVKSVYNQTDSNDGSYAVMDGTTYNYVGNTFANDLSELTQLDDPTVNEENTLYLDNYGNMIAFEATKRNADYLYLQDSMKDLNSARAIVTLADGTEKTVNVDKLTDVNGNVYEDGDVYNAMTYTAAGHSGIYAYTQEGNAYQLTELKDRNAAANSWAVVPAEGAYDDAASDANNVYTIKNGWNAIQYEDKANSITSNIVTLSNSTIFVDVEGGVIYTGYENVPTMTEISFHVVYNKQLAADVVFITDGADNSTSDSFFYITDAEPYTYKGEDGAIYREYEAWVDGEKTKVTTKNLGANHEFQENELYRIDTITPDGFVTAAHQEVRFDAAYAPAGSIARYLTSGTIQVGSDANIANCGSNSLVNSNGDRTYAYNSNTIFMNVQLKANGDVDYVALSNANAINPYQGDKVDGFSNVYVAAVEDNTARTPIATLVYVVNAYTGNTTDKDRVEGTIGIAAASEVTGVEAGKADTTTLSAVEIPLTIDTSKLGNAPKTRAADTTTTVQVVYDLYINGALVKTGLTDAAVVDENGEGSMFVDMTPYGVQSGDYVNIVITDAYISDSPVDPPVGETQATISYTESEMYTVTGAGNFEVADGVTVTVKANDNYVINNVTTDVEGITGVKQADGSYTVTVGKDAVKAGTTIKITVDAEADDGQGGETVNAGLPKASKSGNTITVPFYTEDGKSYPTAAEIIAKVNADLAEDEVVLTSIGYVSSTNGAVSDVVGTVAGAEATLTVTLQRCYKMTLGENTAYIVAGQTKSEKTELADGAYMSGEDVIATSAVTVSDGVITLTAAADKDLTLVPAVKVTATGLTVLSSNAPITDNKVQDNNYVQVGDTLVVTGKAASGSDVYSQLSVKVGTGDAVAQGEPVYTADTKSATYQYTVTDADVAGITLTEAQGYKVAIGEATLGVIDTAASKLVVSTSDYFGKNYVAVLDKKADATTAITGKLDNNTREDYLDFTGTTLSGVAVKGVITLAPATSVTINTTDFANSTYTYTGIADPVTLNTSNTAVYVAQGAKLTVTANDAQENERITVKVGDAAAVAVGNLGTASDAATVKDYEVKTDALVFGAETLAGKIALKDSLTITAGSDCISTLTDTNLLNAATDYTSKATLKSGPKTFTPGTTLNVDGDYVYTITVTAKAGKYLSDAITVEAGTGNTSITVDQESISVNAAGTELTFDISFNVTGN